MSYSEVERFSKDLKVNPALKEEAKKHASNPLAQAVGFAASKGYHFTLEDAKVHLKAKAKVAGKELSDAELDGVAGGWGSCMGDPTCF
jgi:predicted ribosomally synthesized peptide with nif11-like leader